jgi:hypothetical protein
MAHRVVLVNAHKIMNNKFTLSVKVKIKGWQLLQTRLRVASFVIWLAGLIAGTRPEVEFIDKINHAK